MNKYTNLNVHLQKPSLVFHFEWLLVIFNQAKLKAHIVIEINKSVKKP